MVELRLRKIGKSLGVILPKEVLTRLSIQEGSRLMLTENPNGTYRLTPLHPSLSSKLMKTEDIIHRYRKTLRDLSR